MCEVRGRASGSWTRVGRATAAAHFAEQRPAASSREKAVTGRLQQTLSAVASLGGKRGTQVPTPTSATEYGTQHPGARRASAARDSSTLIDRVHFKCVHILKRPSLIDTVQ